MAATIRQRLADYLREQAAWRDEKAAEYPDDRRNQRSAQHLRGLAAYVDRLPDDDPNLRALAAVQEGYGVSEVYVPGENARYLLSRFGFHDDVTDLRGFLDALVSAEVGDNIDLHHEEGI
jgi:hypothetical protein